MTTQTAPGAKKGFEYTPLPYRFHAEFVDGRWQEGELTEDAHLRIEEGATSLHYAQQCFEGLKACAARDGRVLIFRPRDNAARLASSAARLLMPPPPESLFVEAVRAVVAANREHVPAFGSGGSMYLRPLLLGVGHNLGLRTAPRFAFRVFASPVGSYFDPKKAGLRLLVVEEDRAAPHGTGAFKVGGNYAGGLALTRRAKDTGFDEALFLDPLEHRYIEEAASSNVFGVFEGRGGPDVLVTPRSETILPSITLRSLLTLAEEDPRLRVERRRVAIEEVSGMRELACVGTAVVVAPVAAVGYAGRDLTLREAPGRTALDLRGKLVAIQTGEAEDRHGWTLSA